MKLKPERDGRTAAIILSLIHHQRYGHDENEENKVRFFEIPDSDMLKLSGMSELTDEFINDLHEYITIYGLDIARCGNSWLFGNEEALVDIPLLPSGLLESMSPGFVNNYFAELADATEV